MRTPTALLLLVLMSAACSDSRAERAEVATAKCLSAVHDKLGLAQDNTTLRGAGIQVTKLREADQRVVGVVTYRPAEGQERRKGFTCDVTPDDSDTLRHLRVTDLHVIP